MRPDYVKFFSGRVSWVEPSPIREFISRVAKLEHQKKSAELYIWTERP
jgi:hypothetical protein